MAKYGHITCRIWKNPVTNIITSPASCHFIYLFEMQIDSGTPPWPNCITKMVTTSSCSKIQASWSNGRRVGGHIHPGHCSPKGFPSESDPRWGLATRPRTPSLRFQAKDNGKEKASSIMAWVLIFNQVHMILVMLVAVSSFKSVFELLNWNHGCKVSITRKGGQDWPVWRNWYLYYLFLSYFSSFQKPQVAVFLALAFGKCQNCKLLPSWRPTLHQWKEHSKR